MTAVAGPPTLTWQVTGVEPERHAVVPTLLFGLEVGCPGGEHVRSIVLTVSVRIAAPLRDYDPDTRRRLLTVFGTDDQWRDSLRDLVWARPTLTVPPFTGHTTVPVPVPCGQDVDLAATSYLSAVLAGDVPLRFLFSGTVFHEFGGWLRTAQIPWEGEATYRIPAGLWHQVRQRYHGDHEWLRVSRDTAERLRAYQATAAHPSPDAAVDALLADAAGGPTARSTP